MTYKQDLPYVPYNSANKDYARFNRNNPTKAESLFWNYLLKWDKTWFRFVRQKTILWFIADFYCSKLLLVIEIDWWYHNETCEYDEDRSKILEEQFWIKIIRFTNEEIETNLDGVVKYLEDIIKEREKDQ